MRLRFPSDRTRYGVEQPQDMKTNLQEENGGVEFLVSTLMSKSISVCRDKG